MGQYCGFCGRYVNDGEVCTCQGAQQQLNQQNPYPTMGPQQGPDPAQGQYTGQNYDPYGGQYGQNTDPNQNWNPNANGYPNGGQNWNPNQNWNQNGYQGGGQNWGGNQNWGQPPQKTGTNGLKSYLKRLGFMGGEEFGDDAYERDLEIAPDCLDLSDGETPIKQYTVAKMNNRVLGIPIERAVGKLQVTNKRVIFRAPGTGIAGRICQTNEFSVDELAGVTAQKRFVFQPWALFVSILCGGVGFVAFLLLSMAFKEANNIKAQIALYSVFGTLFGFGGLVPFFLVRKKWFLKTMGLGFSFGAFLLTAILLRTVGKYGRGLEGAGAAKFFGVVFIIFAVITGIVLLISIAMGSLRPDLVLMFRGKTAVPAISVYKTFFQRAQDMLAGYTEILPAKDVDKCIREVNAIINDIQKLGDYAVEKWKAKA